ncbi:MAG: DUF6717 family protein [Bacteroidales bacterium]
MDELILPFYKKGDKWYALVEGKSEEDNEMVMGADKMLEYISDDIYFELKLTPNVPLRDATLSKLTECDEGCTYLFKSFEEVDFGMEIWICDVTTFVFGEFPKTIKLERVASSPTAKQVVIDAIKNNLDVIESYLEYKYTN